jgi:hypothetical protein
MKKAVALLSVAMILQGAATAWAFGRHRCEAPCDDCGGCSAGYAGCGGYSAEYAGCGCTMQYQTTYQQVKRTVYKSVPVTSEQEITEMVCVPVTTQEKRERTVCVPVTTQETRERTVCVPVTTNQTFQRHVC